MMRSEASRTCSSTQLVAFVMVFQDVYRRHVRGVFPFPGSRGWTVLGSVVDELFALCCIARGSPVIFQSEDVSRWASRNKSTCSGCLGSVVSSLY